MKQRIADIEILRAFAVLLVVLHHMHSDLITRGNWFFDRFATYVNGGVGVDLFFAISGFVIARDLLPRLTAYESWNGAFRITLAFWLRRAWRLLPSAWLWLLLILLAVVFFNESGAFGHWGANFQATVAGVLQFANIRFAKTFGTSEYGASFVYWSLSLEEQFYLCLPLIVIIFRRWLPVVLVFLVVLQWVVPRSMMMIVLRTDAILLGVLLSIWSRLPIYEHIRPTLLQRIPGRGTVPILLILSCMGVIASQDFPVASHKFSLVAVLAALAVWLTSYNENLLFARSPLRKVLLWLGSRSYGVYLIHVPVFFFIREVCFRSGFENQGGDHLSLFMVVSAVTLTIILSEANYRLIEQRFRLVGTKMSDRILNAIPTEHVGADPIKSA